MNDIILELQQQLIKTQDSFKDAIMSEPDAEKHISIITKFSKDEVKITESVTKEIKKLEVVEIIKEIAVEVVKEKEVLFIFDAKYFTDKYTSAKIKAVAKKIGVKTTGTETQVAELILAKISAEEFEKLLAI